MTAELVVYKPKNAFKTITVCELNTLGYELTGRDIPLGKKPTKYTVMEVKNDDNNHAVGFCFLYSAKSGAGIILPNIFNHYLLHPENIMAGVSL